MNRERLLPPHAATLRLVSVASALLTVCALLTSPLLSRRALAQEASADVLAARAHFTEGQAAFAAHDYASAAQHFEQALALAPHGAVMFNLARSFERLARTREAIVQYERALASEQLDPAAVAEVEASLVTARARLGTIELRGRPGDEVTLADGRSCTLPCELTVDPGLHRITLERDGRTATARAEVTAGARVVRTLELPDLVQPPVVEREAPVQHGGDELPVFLIVGTPVALIGVAGTVGFGLHTLGLRQQYDAEPTHALLREGNQSRDLTNVSIAVAAAGAVLIAIDIVLWLMREGAPSQAGMQGRVVRF